MFSALEDEVLHIEKFNHELFFYHEEHKSCQRAKILRFFIYSHSFTRQCTFISFIYDQSKSVISTKKFVWKRSMLPWIMIQRQAAVNLTNFRSTAWTSDRLQS